MSLVGAFKQQLRTAHNEIAVMVFSVAMAWVMGFLIPTVLLMYA